MATTCGRFFETPASLTDEYANSADLSKSTRLPSFLISVSPRSRPLRLASRALEVAQ